LPLAWQRKSRTGHENWENLMQLHTDTSKKIAVNSALLPWVASPMKGIDRKMLERDGQEIARATSVVQYAPGSSFASHGHALGEEIFVLQGTFSDEHGQYPAGTYVKNPPGSAHTPHTQEGCTLFVKLRHLDPDDSERTVVQTQSAAWFAGLVDGLSVMPLSAFGSTSTALVRWAPGTYFNPHRHFGGEEIFVIDGVFEDEHGRYPAGFWLRSPHMSSHKPFSVEGCTIWVKTGHLPPA
jgi:anti-sigma factor ChrR (cupin superfamily)